MAHTPWLLVSGLGCSLCLAQPALVNTYGTGCSSGSAPVPAIQFSARPRIGTSFQVVAANLPNALTPELQWPVLLVGLQQLALPVPPLLPQQPPNCTLLSSGDVFLMMAPQGTTFATQAPFTLPNAAGLIGFTVYMQWASILHAAGAPAAIVFSQGAAVQIGT